MSGTETACTIRQMKPHGTLPDKLARLVGAAPSLPGEVGPEPETIMDWALYWASKGLHVFPCESYIGNPLAEKWHKAATRRPGQIAEFWAAHPDADIACVPDLSGHFAIGIVGKVGLASLSKIESVHGKLDPSFTIKNAWGNQYLLFNGTALSSHEKLGPGVHVFGTGRYLFLPPSLTRIPEELSSDQRGSGHHG